MKNLFILALIFLAISCGNKSSEVDEKKAPAINVLQKDTVSSKTDLASKEITQQINTKEKIEVGSTSLPIVSGRYNNGRLILAYDGKIVTGLYANGHYAGNPNFGCSFYFFGDISNTITERAIKIKTLNPFNLTEKPREGTFKLHGEEDELFSLVADLNGDDCWDQALGFADIGVAPGVSFQLSSKESWLEIRVGATEKVYFYTSADESTKRKAYVLKNDPLFITERSGDWLKASYIGAKSTTSGWVKRSETNSLAKIASKAKE